MKLRARELGLSEEDEEESVPLTGAQNLTVVLEEEARRKREQKKKKKSKMVPAASVIADVSGSGLVCSLLSLSNTRWRIVNACICFATCAT